MASTFTIISTVLLTTGVLLFMQGVALVVLYVVKWRQGRLSAVRNDDHANIMILFQSMRDLLQEQKQLARQLNEDIDRKLTRINLVVHDALETARRPSSRTSAGASASSSPRTQAERDAREAFLREAKKLSSTGGSGTASTPGATSTAATGQPASAPRKADGSSPQAPPVRPETPEGFRAVAEDEPAEGPTGERFDAWVGLDFADDAPNPYRVEIPEQPPASPGDAEKAREAFRSLLDMHHEPEAEPPAAEPARPAAPARGIGAPPRPESSDTNGERKLTPLQRRVQEYADAGMSVPQIARELGIGKGEVRLILSLREGRKV